MRPYQSAALLAIAAGKGNEPINAPTDGVEWHCRAPDCGHTEQRPKPPDMEAFNKNLAIRQGRGIGGGVGGYKCPACDRMSLLPRGL